MRPFLNPPHKYVVCIKSIQFYSHDNKASDEFKTKEVRNVRFYKRVFSWGLFGLTLAGALYLKKKKRKELAEVLGDARRLPDKFGDLVLYETSSGFILSDHVLKMLKKAQQFPFNENDIVLISYPKTGERPSLDCHL